MHPIARHALTATAAAVCLAASTLLGGVAQVFRPDRTSAAPGIVRSAAPAPEVATAIDRRPFPSSGLQLERQTRPGAFFDVVGRRAALFGYENRTFEAWVYPL